MPSKLSRLKIVFLIIAVIMLVLAGAWFWPIRHEEYAIEFDRKMIAVKNSYLGEPAAAPPGAPNIVLILADDLGKTDISLYGSPFVDTPNIDSIGQDGVTFTEGYVTAPVCSPSRAGLLTGRYQQRYGFHSITHDRYAKNILEYLFFKNVIAELPYRVSDLAAPPKEEMDKQGLPPSELSLAELAGKYGYRTGIFGKWHLGYSERSAPYNRGFQENYEFRGGFSMYDHKDDPEVVNHPHDDFTEPFIWARGRTGASAIRRNGTIIDEERYLTDAIAEETNAFIEASKNRPFFAYVPMLAPHTPFQATRKHFEDFAHIRDHNKRVYYAMIASLDEAVGKILRKLEEAGIADNTLVIFLSDNGGATYTHATENAPLKGGKLSNFEGGINVPFMMRWPAGLQSGARYDHPVMATDIFATVASLLRANLPKDRVYDGVDLLPYLTGRKVGAPHIILFWQAEGHKAVRRGDYKLIHDEKTGSTVLYNIAEDKNEENNLAEERPEMVWGLLREHARWSKQMKAPLWPPVAEFLHVIDGKKYLFPL
jgi:arylsulfatase A-like enzyme